MSQIFYTSDLHLFHELVRTHRGYETEKVAAEFWDSQVSKRDTVYVLGDLCISNLAGALEWIKERPGTKHLVSGNHDQVNPQHRGALAAQRKWLDAFDSVTPWASRRMGADKSRVMMSHYPYNGDRGADRDPFARLRDVGHPVLHGHTHSGDKISYSDLGTLQVHVGWDAWGRMVPEEHVVDLIEKFRDVRAGGLKPANAKKVCTCWRLRRDGTHGKGCDFHLESEASV